MTDNEVQSRSYPINSPGYADIRQFFFYGWSYVSFMAFLFSSFIPLHSPSLFLYLFLPGWLICQDDSMLISGSFCLFLWIWSFFASVIFISSYESVHICPSIHCGSTICLLISGCVSLWVLALHNKKTPHKRSSSENIRLCHLRNALPGITVYRF